MPTPPSPDTDASDVDIIDAAARMRLATARLARQLRQQAGTGLSPSQQSALVSIAVNKTLTLGALAAIEKVAPPTVTKVVSKLEDEGLVVRTVDTRDRRVAHVAITESGRDRLRASRSRREAWLAQRLEELPPGDLDRLAAALDVLEALAGNPMGVTHTPDAVGDAGDTASVSP